MTSTHASALFGTRPTPNILAKAFLLVVLATTLLGSTLAWSQATVNESEETATLWVDTSKGSDSNPGTQQLPLKTIGAAAALAFANNQASIGTKVDHAGTVVHHYVSAHDF
jgi:hypothetical protein